MERRKQISGLIKLDGYYGVSARLRIGRMKVENKGRTGMSRENLSKSKVENGTVANVASLN